MPRKHQKQTDKYGFQTKIKIKTKANNEDSINKIILNERYH